MALSSVANAAACSPTTSSVNGETLLVFSTIGNCTWTVPSDITNVELLVVGGGGSASAGIANIYWPGGGGGGGVETRSGFAVTPGSTLSVTTGSGGGATASSSGATGNNGTASSFGSITANGGLTPSNTATANAGAKGGASGNGNLGETGSASGINCSSGSCGTGGGGGSEAAGSGLNGGSGITSSITGTAVGYGGGGAGGNGASGTASDGGAVGYYASTSASATGNAAANTGGGGARNASGYGGAGGSGVVIVRYIAIPAGSSALRFDSNGGTGSKDTQVLTTGSTATAPTISRFSKSGSFFTAWNTAADGSGNSYRPGATFTLTGNALLYAQWQATTFLGTTYSATKYSFGGGSNSGVVDCAAGNVLVGAAFQQSPMNVANYCVPLLSDLTVAPLSSSVRATSNYVFCPDGMVAIGYKYISGVKLGLQCKTPPGLSDTVVETSFITASTTVSRGATAYSGSSMCNAGDVVVGFSRSWNLWLDSHGARCAPFAKYYISYNANGSVTTAPTTTTQSVPQEWLTVASYSGVRTGYHFSGWNTANTGLGTDYAVGLEIAPGGNTALFAKWTSTITYDSNSATSGTVPSPTVAVGTQAQTLLATNSGTLAKTGYTFTGWNTAANGSGTNYAAGLTTYSSPGDITLYAQWKSTITYNTNTATGTVPTAVITKGSASGTFALNSGAGLTKTGLTFAGWNTAANGSGTNYAGGETYTSSGDITLYAVFRPSISYNANGANTGSVPATVIGSSITVSDNVGSLVRTGYTLTGWNTASNGTGTHYNFLASLSPSVGLVLYAEWSGNNYAITFNSNGGSGTMADSAIVAGTAKNLTANAFTRTGYSFQGWTTNSNGTGTTYTNSQSVTLYADTVLYAKWLGNTYTVTFGNTPGTSGSTNPCLCAPDQSFTAGTPFTLNTNVWYRTGYIFAGWSTISGNGSPIVYAERDTVTFYANISIYTQWNPVYTVTFSANSGTGTAPTALTQATFGSAVTLPATTAMTRTGFTAAGWNTAADGSGTGYAVGASYTPSAAITLYVKWNPLYTVTFSANSGTGTAPTALAQTSFGGAITLPATTAMTRAGFTAAGWNSAADGSGTGYAAGSSYTPSATITLYVKWNIVVTYLANGGSGSAPAAAIATISGGVNSVVVANANTLTRTRYTFAGWNTLANGSGTNYAAGSTFNVTTSVSLYAQWNSTITYNANTSANTTGTVPSPTVAKSSESVTALAVNSGNLARTGYTFGGWNTQADGKGTSYASSGGINGLPNLYMRFQASDFNTSTTVWVDSSGFDRNIPDTATTGTESSLGSLPHPIPMGPLQRLLPLQEELLRKLILAILNSLTTHSAT